ncbi:MAG: tetratricopeptide repeat protein, partial [bacterium]|nr:tetratricopeptide repeat protein [bacterium]
MISIRYIKLSFVLLLLGTVSCNSVYYNTYFNARKQYHLADLKRLESETPGSRITPAVYKQIYMIAIKKASAVIELHPNSKWVDDSILMIGKSFYWRGDYGDALTKFQEMQENFPQSDLIPETLYWQGLTYWASGQLNEARLSFALVGERGDADLQAKARLALAEIEVAEENYEDAIEAYQDLRNTLGKKHSLQAQAWRGIGNGHFYLRHYNKALEAYQHALKSRPSTKINFETRARMGEVLELQGKLEEAQQMYERILKIKRLKIYTPEVRIKQANLHTLLGQHEAALESYEAIAKDNPRTQYSAEAYYRMGLIEQKYRKDLDQAKDYFNKASREKRSSDAAIQAIQRGKDLSALERYIKQIEKEKGGKRSLPPMFELAELYLFRLGELDSALVTYRRALTVADTVDVSYAPKALFSIGVIQADSLENQTEARETFQKLIDTYPLTDYAIEARKRIQYNRTDDALAEARFLESENQQLEGAP